MLALLIEFELRRGAGTEGGGGMLVSLVEFEPRCGNGGGAMFDAVPVIVLVGCGPPKFPLELELRDGTGRHTPDSHLGSRCAGG
mmetsp:Transcript_42580/g.97653  ORF Transcript_42580/g.97653 Transcript_42580/m.97653 type:complete len:84 (-) Transcript_42580:642-893(-)